MEEEKRLVDKMESDRKEIALVKAKHEERMSQECELVLLSRPQSHLTGLFVYPP